MGTLPRYAKARPVIPAALPLPPAWVEYGFYLLMMYSVWSTAVGFEIPFFGTLLIFFLSTACILRFHSSPFEFPLQRLKAFYAPIGWLFLFLVSYLLIQLVIHGEPIGDFRDYINWILMLVIVYMLRRLEGFHLRLPFIYFCIGAPTVAFLTFATTGHEVARVAIPVGANLAHPAGFAEWFAFSAVFFSVFAVETRRPYYRIAAWALAVSSFLIATLSVERGPLFAAAIAIVVGCRKLLKRGFLPVFLLIVVTFVLSEAGLFDKAFEKYSERAFEATGRELLWPAAIERIRTSPLIGLGESHIGLTVLGPQVIGPAPGVHPPHNVFLHIAMASGFIPLVFFLGFWIRAARNSLKTPSRSEDVYRLPYLLFTFIVLNLGDLGHLAYSGVITISAVAGAPSTSSGVARSGILRPYRNSLSSREHSRQRSLSVRE